MKKQSSLILSLLFSGLYVFSQPVGMLVPGSDAPVADTFFGTAVMDKYRYLENLNSGEVQAWVHEQHSTAVKYLRKMKGNHAAFLAINEYGFADFDLPLRQGEYYFSLMYSDPNRPASLYYQKRRDGNPVLLVNPDDISAKDKISLGGFKLSKDSRYLAYQFHRGGADWAEIKVVRMNGKDMSDHLKHIKFSGISWQGEGFYYSMYRVEDSLSNLINQEIRYHALGDVQEKDRLVFARPQRPSTQIDIQVTSDERFCIIREEDEKAGILNYYYKDALDTAAAIRPLYRRPKYDYDFLDSHEGYLYALTSTDGNNRILVKINPSSPKELLLVLPEVEDAILLDAVLLEKYIAVSYQIGIHQKLVFFTYGGDIKHVIQLLDYRALGPLQVNKHDRELIYFYQSYLVPPVVSRLDIATFERTPLQKTGITFNLDEFDTREVEYPSKDGTLVPMTILFKKGLKLDGKNPTLLSAYGGFGLINQPSFRPGLVYFLDKGGVFAVAKIRGGGEKGVPWHKAGIGRNKQNTFDDFIAAAEYLIRENYTSPRHLAITGGSHGGLVVGVAMTQRPELFRAAVPVAGVFDMLRCERFTVGDFHTDEFGTVKTADGFRQLYSYSPLHNIEPGVNYPATLIITAEYDDRVPPLHSYKFAAALQNNPGQTNPILLSVRKKAGHHIAHTFEDRIQYEADVFSFVLYHTKE